MSYDYGEVNGPHTWALRFPAAAGCRQSPINLNTSHAIHDASLKRLSIQLHKATEQKLVVRAHNFSVSAGNGGVLSGGPLDSEYSLVQFHFHWGSGNCWGSEHTVNGMSSSGELHMVFMNTKYESFDRALEEPDGLSVVGVFIRLAERSNPALEKIAFQLKDVEVNEEKLFSPPLHLIDLLPVDFTKYYTYPGSLTTPPCKECVTWILMDEAISISQTHLDLFRQVHDGCQTCGSTDNFRPLCPVGSRSVRSSFPC